MSARLARRQREGAFSFAVLLTGLSFAQSALAADVVDTQQYLALIEREEDTRGPTAPTLLEPLTTLGQYYFAQGDYERAYDSFARARQILRMNEGLDTLPELPLIAQLVRTEEARGRFEEAWELEEGLLGLAERHAGRIETLPIFREAADKRLDLWDRYRRGEIPPQIVLGCYYDRQGYLASMGGRPVLTDSSPQTRDSCMAGDRRMVRLALLIEARSYQMHALEALLQNGRYASDEMWAQFTATLRTSYGIMTRARGFADPPLANMMSSLLAHEPDDSAGRVRRAQILVQLADMNVVRARELDRYVGYAAVAEQYRQARDALQNEGVSPAELDAMFAPELPVALPSFASSALGTVAATEAGGYIDVRFEVTPRGKARRMDIVGTSPGVERAQRRALEQLLYRTTFRPRLVDGELVAATPVHLRYYLPAGTPPQEECVDDERDAGGACTE